jgi:hypothetical protein
MSKRGRTKGKAFESRVARTIAEAIGVHDSDVLNSRGGKTEPDIHLSWHASALYPFHTECKDCKSIRMPAWLRQAEKDAPEGRIPTVVFKLHGNSKIYIAVPFDIWLERVSLNSRTI